MKISIKWPVLALCLCAPMTLPTTAQAHRVWMLPSATVLSGDDVWITVDAAVSNDLFYFEHFPLQIANLGGSAPATRGRGRPGQLSIIAPDGSPVEHQNGSMGRYRSTFDVHLTQKGTYKVAVINSGVFASYKENGQAKRWSGTAEEFAKAVPANAEDLRSTYSQSRMEVFVTSGKPTAGTLKITGRGLELAPVTHPNDLVAGSAATFKLMLDGQPAPNLKVTVIPGGNRYRDKLGEMSLTTDAEGKVSITWPTPGMYWMEAVVRDDKTPVKELKQRRAIYVATFEVLPP
jgi:uncharacterized GH25 family protein